MKQKHLSRAGRKAQIITFVHERMSVVGVSSTAYAIAKGIGLEPSNHVRKIINELVNEGWLNQNEITDLFGRKVILHWLTKDADELMKRKELVGRVTLEVMKSWFEQ